MNDRQDTTPPRPRLVCPACRGEGDISTPRLAMLGGVGRTIVTSQQCRWCEGTGWQDTFSPPL